MHRWLNARIRRSRWIVAALERAKLKETLAPFCKRDARGKVRADCDNDTFTIKYVDKLYNFAFLEFIQYARCLGVFDTVGSVGLPETLTLRSPKSRNLLGMKDSILGDHVERAYQALALNELRRDFVSISSHSLRLVRLNRPPWIVSDATSSSNRKRVS